MILETINPLESTLWSQLVANTQTTVFHSTEWISALANTYEWKPQANILLNDSAEPIAGIVYFLIDDFRGKRIISLPFTDFCDPIARTDEDWQCISKPLLNYHLPIKMRCLHSQLLAEDDQFQLINQAVWHRIDVQRKEEDVWRDIRSSARRAIRKSERSGLSVEFRNDKEALQAFFDLHLGIRKYKHRLLPQPYKFFEILWEQFIKPGKGCIATAIHDEKVVGSIIYLQWQDTLYYKYSASALDELSTRPTDRIIFESIRYAKQKGLNYIDFGLSEIEHEGLIRFKRKYASDEKLVSFYGYKADIVYPEPIKRVNKLLGELTDILTQESIPDGTTAHAGDVMYRFFI
ncbi:GNAT family N-acetyltransferase [bacterium]|nr:GNAT family N-acetyltransferase [bacterium]